MNCKRALTIIGFGTAAALPLSALSQVQGAYAGASMGSANAKEFCKDVATNIGTTPSTCDKNSTAWRIFSGVRFTRNIGAEIAYVDLGKASASDPGTGTTAQIESAASEAVAVLTYPANRLAVFGKVGGYYGKTKSTFQSPLGTTYGRQGNGGLTYGLGAQYDFTPNVGLRGDWQRYAKVGGSAVGGDTDIDVWLVGLVWNFR